MNATIVNVRLARHGMDGKEEKRRTIMIVLQMIQKICKEHDNFCSSCPFRSQHLTGKFSDCLFYSFPYDWNIDEISKAFDDSYIIKDFYLIHQLLQE